MRAKFCEVYGTRDNQPWECGEPATVKIAGHWYCEHHADEVEHISDFLERYGDENTGRDLLDVITDPRRDDL